MAPSSAFSRTRWSITTLASAGLLLFALTVAAAKLPSPSLDRLGASAPTAEGYASPSLRSLAARSPDRRVEVIVQLGRGTGADHGRRLVSGLGGRTTGELHVINALAARMTAAKAEALASKPGVRVVSLNAAAKKNSVSKSTAAVDSSQLSTSYPASVRAPKAWSKGGTGKGVGVAVVDTGIAESLPDFRTSQLDHSSRVVATAVTNPDATDDQDGYGHGTHVAGIIAGNGSNRDASDPLHGKYAGVAPEANLVSVKVADEDGGATVLDVIYGLQFVIDFKDTYNIRVVNLSLESTEAQSYKTDPLAAAAEAAWFNGIVVVAAAGNRGSASDSVDYAPGNDPYVISVGGVDDQGTKNTLDDAVADWSSHGETQDGHAKPDVLAPGAHIVSNLAPGSDFSGLCETCIVSDEYIRAGGTSMAAPMVAGAAAALLQVRPELTPDQVKGTIMANGRKVGHGSIDEVSVAALVQNPKVAGSNQGLSPNELIDAATGQIDYTRSRWSRSRWSRSRWSRSRWSCECFQAESESIDPTRSRWSRSRWSRSRWSASWTK